MNSEELVERIRSLLTDWGREEDDLDHWAWQIRDPKNARVRGYLAHSGSASSVILSGLSPDQLVAVLRALVERH